VSGRVRLNPFTVMALALLGLNSLSVLVPAVFVLFSSFKSTREIFADPFAFPAALRLDNYLRVLEQASFIAYLRNSFIVTLAAVLVILVASSLAGYALGRFRFRGNDLIYIFILSGMMLPLKLAIIPLFIMMRDLSLLDNHLSLILVYAAMGIPPGVFIMTGFFRSLPGELDSAARVDGASEWSILRYVMLPLVRPALVIVAIYNAIPIWNDFFFPLVFIQTQERKTIMQGMTVFFGQYQTEWSLLFAGLTLAALPLILLYLLMSDQFIKGLTSGAVK